MIYGNGDQIVQSPGVVTITYEMIHDTRIIPTDGRPHVGPTIRQYLGDAIGHWEGDELVVETTNFTNKTAIGVNGNGNRHSPQLKLTERFKRVAKDVVQYQVTVDDPLTYERPFTMSMPLTPLDGGRILPYSCHEGNMALTQSLGGERAEDRRLEEDRAKGIIRARRPVQDGLGVGGAPAGPGGGFGGRGAGGRSSRRNRRRRSTRRSRGDRRVLLGTELRLCGFCELCVDRRYCAGAGSIRSSAA